ncbi:MAG: sulfotransferase family 2 domain-containing protein [Sphingomonadaceae bacterium]|nr:sulfotransferase family 2 domain-containing protein [Sphingomonadaceae bacterium]
MGIFGEELGYIFVHVPKTAGSSIEAVLEKRSRSVNFSQMAGLVEAITRNNDSRATKIGGHKHAAARDLRSALTPVLYDELLSFGVVRDPWQRMRSRYYYARGLKKDDIAEPINGSLDEFALWACQHRPSSLSERLADDDGRLLVRRVLRNESLNEDFGELTEEIFGQRLSLPMLNVSKRPAAEEAFGAKAAAAIRSTYANDFALFGYTERQE